VRCGGGAAQPAGLGHGKFFAPTVLTGVTHDMRIMREEVLGPVLAIVEVRSEDEAIDLANDSRFGLGASVWTADRGKGERIARRLEAGSVWVNDHMHSHGPVRRSWSGTKESGLGRTHARFGFYECVHVKHVTSEPAGLRSFRWQPYDEALGTALHAAAELFYGRDEDKRAALKRGALPFARIGRRVLGGARRR
jgi:succinate-semialdehyde dehydrogenase/glutarate-semialdehyde dehydrogenase